MDYIEYMFLCGYMIMSAHHDIGAFPAVTQRHYRHLLKALLHLRILGVVHVLLSNGATHVFVNTGESVRHCEVCTTLQR